ncbi:MAG: pseudouridine synthase [Rudaea sp.]
MLLTNDGDLTFRLTHPRYEHEKEYLALVAGQPDIEGLQRLKRGINYQDQWLRVDQAALAGRKQPFGEAGREQSWLRIVLHEGKKREIRHMCSAIGHPVLRLVRIRIGPVELGALKPGRSRPLTAIEIRALQEGTRAPAKRPPRKPKAERRGQPSERAESRTPEGRGARPRRLPGRRPPAWRR